MKHTRQALAAYAFFEDARKEQPHTEDALLPFVLPAISGRGGEIFSAESLAKAIEPIFGPELVLPLAESLVETLTRHKYLEQKISDADGAIYVYTDKTCDIPLTESVSRAESDLADVLKALKEYIVATKPLKAVMESATELRSQFIDWITTAELPLFDDRVGSTGRSAATYAAGDKEGQVDDRLSILFSGFVEWLSRERAALFEKVATFAELGLVIDLVSEIRVPTRKARKVDLTVVLDSTIVMELIGAAGPIAQKSAQRLIELCREYKVLVITLAHLVDEVSEICYNVINEPESGFKSSVNDAYRKYPEVRQLINKLNKSPDAVVRASHINIVPYTQTHDVRANASFRSDDIDKFADFLPYDKSKPKMAQRDAWSLAYAVRRQGGTFTSNVYESKCVVVTRSRAFANAAKRFLRENGGYPYYAVTPVIELRHFSTLFMLAFGSDATRQVIRAELIASCDRVLRASPGLTRKIRGVLRRMEELSEEQIDAALADPATLAEFALVTGNDLDVVSAHNGPALLAVIRNVTIKEEELRHREAEDRLNDQLTQVIDDSRAAVEQAERMRREAEEREVASQHRTDELARQMNEQEEFAASVIEERIRKNVRQIWFVVIIVALVFASLPVIDLTTELTNLPDGVRIGLTAAFGVFVVYSTVALFLPKVQPQVLRAWITDIVASRHLTRAAPESLSERVKSRLAD